MGCKPMPRGTGCQPVMKRDGHVSFSRPININASLHLFPARGKMIR
jgi:hypothetical protein